MSATLRTRCAIAGGGPAGMMLGYLLARAGLDVVVLEKHADFLRDFRGDTIHPSTLGLMNELGLIDRFLALPHGATERLTARIGGERFVMADFTHLPEPVNRLVFMPQWDFLDFLAGEAKRYPGFHLVMRGEATDLVRDGDGRVSGLEARTPEGPLRVEADLVVACDGRHSTIREAAGLAAADIGAPMDVLWFSLPREAGDQAETGGAIEAGGIVVTIDRGDHWQCGLVIAKGGDAAIRAGGLEAFRARVAAIAPGLGPRLAAIRSLHDVKLLTVGVDRLPRWRRPGLLLIGDAAHTMSPVGGVGINLAIQDAVAAANLLAPVLRAGVVGEADLAAVQKRREWPVRVTQAAQVLIQNRVLVPVLAAQNRPKAPLLLRLLAATGLLGRLAARAIGMGVRPEHVSADILARHGT